jgi:hypothetical protein
MRVDWGRRFPTEETIPLALLPLFEMNVIGSDLMDDGSRQLWRPSSGADVCFLHWRSFSAGNGGPNRKKGPSFIKKGLGVETGIVACCHERICGLGGCPEQVNLFDERPVHLLVVTCNLPAN